MTDLNIENWSDLLGYLRQRSLIDSSETPIVQNLDGGVSNRVVLVKRDKRQSFVLKQALEKLRVQVDWFCTPERIQREALALRYLSELAPAGAVPALIFQDPQHHLLAMAEVPQPHQNWKQMLLAGNIVREHVEQFAVLLGSIHQHSSQQAEEFSRLFGDRAIFETLRLEPYYRYTATQLPQAAHFLESLIDDTLACNMALVHGDFSPKNVLVHDGRLVLLDYEVVHFGDPAFDIGFAMAHFLGKANHLRSHRTQFLQTATQFWERYASCLADQNWSAALESRAVRHTLACCLARVAGRSPLEYLTASERTLQAKSVLGMLDKRPDTIQELVESFGERIACQSFEN